MKAKNSQINLADVTNILKDHNTFPMLITKDEVSALIRLINVSASDRPVTDDIMSLDYNQFLKLIP